MSYQALAARHRRLAHLQHVEAIASWDEAAMMPAGGGETRAEALATLRVLAHELATDPALGPLLEPPSAQAAARRADRMGSGQPARDEARLRARDRLPAALVEASSLAESRCEQAWRILRPAQRLGRHDAAAARGGRAQARGGGRAGRPAGAGALRRAAGRLRARRAQRQPSTRCSPICGRSCPASSPGDRAPGRASRCWCRRGRSRSNGSAGWAWR